MADLSSLLHSLLELDYLAKWNGLVTYVQGIGSIVESGAPAGIWIVKTTDFTAVKNNAYYCDSSGAALIATLPETPTTGDAVRIGSGPSASTNNLTVARNGQTIMGVAANLTISDNNVEVNFVFDGTTWGLA